MWLRLTFHPSVARKAIEPPTHTGWVTQVSSAAIAAAGRPKALRTHV